MDNNVVAKHILDVAVGLEKKSKNELIVELSDIFDNASKIDLNSKENINSLKNLAKAFEAIFSKAGNKSINFEDLIKMPPPSMFAEMGKIAATSFWDAWNSVSKGMGGNTTQEMMREQFKQLEQQRSELLKRQKTLSGKPRKYEKLSSVVNDMPYMDENEFEAFTKEEIKKMGGNIDKIALEMQEKLKAAERKLSHMSLDDSDYDAVLEDMLKKANDVFRMSKTLEKHPNIVKDKTILEDYDFSYLKDEWEGLEEYSIRLDGIIKQVTIELDAIPSQLQEIDKQLAQIQKGGVDIVDQSTAKNGLKTLNEIKEAYNNLRVAQEERIDKNQAKRISTALDFDPSKSGEGIKTLYAQYQDAAASGNWVEEYRALLKYVRLYEHYLTTENKAHRNKITKRGNEFTPLYEQLKPMADNARNMLQNILNMGEGKPLVGMGGADKEKAEVGPTPEDVTNTQKVSAEAEKIAQSDNEAAEATKQKRIEEEKIVAAAGKAADEAERELSAKKESQNYTAYRAVQPPTGSGKTKSDALEDWGAEYFTTRKDTAASYGQDFYEKGDIVIGEITPKNPLVINANGVRWDEFEKMPGIKEVFPELIDLIKANPQWTGDDKQKYINERARAMGYDSVVTENVQDALDGDKKQYELSTTIAVLDDSIVRLAGSMEQLEAGTNKFSDTVSPKIPSYYVGGQRGGEDASAEVQDVGAAFKRLIDYINSSGQEPKQFFSALAGGAQNVNDELKQILSILGLFDSQGSLNLKSIESGFTNLGGMVSDTYTLIARGKDYLPKSQDLMPKLIDAKKMGANVGEILDVFEDETAGRIYELQKTMPGTIIPDNTDFLQATNDQILNLIADLEVLHKTGLSIDFGNDNILYDKEKGFSFIDLGTKFKEGQETVAGTAQEFLKSIKSAFADNEVFENFEKRLVGIANGLGVKIPQAAQSAEQAVDKLNTELQETNGMSSSSGISGGAGDASLADLEAERAKTEALQDELDHRIGALQSAHDEKEMLQSDLNIANEQIKIAQDSEVAARARADETDLKLIEKEKHIQALEEQLAQTQISDGDAMFAAEQRAKEAEDRAYMYDRAMTSMEEEMADLRGQLARAKTGSGEEYTSASLEELKNVLNSIVYNVKNAHDDNDKSANKIAPDDATLESTLTKVFSNIINSQTQQSDSEQKHVPWALESTLQVVKGVLENIHTNTTKIGTINPSNVDTIAGTALDGRLTEIKSVLESIDNKIAKGGAIATRGAIKQASTQPVESEVKVQAARSNILKSIINDYKTLGKLSAQFANDGNLETKAMLDNLKEEISRKRQSLKITMDENASLREKYSIAFDAEKRLLDAAKAQEKIDKQDKDDKVDWKKQVKDAQRSTGINAATTAANAGDQTVLRAIGTEGVSKDIENKAKELSNQIKALRVLRDEIDKKGEKASAEDRDNLSKQISRVKTLKAEVDGYLKIHEKYSGDNVTDLGDASNFGAVGTDQYWNNITAAIKNASSGKTAIKGLNADTGELTGTTKIAAHTFATWSATVDPLTGRLSMLRTGIKKTETIIEQITRKTKEIFTYFSGSSMIFKVFNELKKGVQYVRDIDLALTELKKVTDETEETYDKFLKTASKTAEKVGSTIKNVVSSTADWARLGYSMEQAAKFAETTQILMNVSEFTDVSQATDTLISSVQAFGYTAETSMDVVDLLNTIGKIIAYR